MNYKLAVRLLKAAKKYVRMAPWEGDRYEGIFVCRAIRQAALDIQVECGYVEVSKTKSKLVDWIGRSIGAPRIERWLCYEGLLPYDWHHDWAYWGPIVQRYRHDWIDQMVQLLEEET